MSMTREEAAKKLSLHLMQCGMLMPFEWIKANGDGSDFQEAFRMAISALRPVSREQVEKVWRGQWIDCSNGWMCSRCENDNTYAKPFCPSCGAAMTDEAVDIVMKRLEALRGDR